MADLNTYTHEPKSGGKPKSIVILLHGLGANGQDLISLAQYWQDSLPDTVFVSPDVPFECDMAPGMMNSYQWFSLQNRDPHVMLRGVEESAPVLNSYIDKILQDYDLSEKNAALVGFSQGTMMSLFVGPRRPQPLAGIVGYSGALIGAEGLGGSNITKPPIHLIHGEADDVVPVQAHSLATGLLTQSGFTVSGHTTPGLGHGIDNDGIESASTFLTGTL